jgi:peptidyl-dipeptidase Dcp
VANVIEAWEASGQLLTRALKAFQAKQLADTDAELDAIESAIAPLLAAHADAISLDWALYDRVVALAARRDAGDIVLDVQEASWLERTLLAHGGSIDVMDAYRDYRGQDPDLTHLLERRGLNPG